MFADLHNNDGNSVFKADICVIGAGAAGISLAREFIGSNLSILLIESGDLQYDTRNQALNGGKITGLRYPRLDSIRLRYFGGTTNHWTGQSALLNRIDFENREWVKNSGWPIDYEEYRLFVPRAQEVCKLGEQPIDWEFWQQYFSFPLSGDVFEPVMFRFPDPITRFGREYRQQIKHAKNITCLLNANVTNITVDANNDVEYLTVKSLRDANVLAKAKIFVMACGAIQNIKLMLNSRDKHTHGIGNEYGLVGKYFMEHPNYETGEIQLRNNSDYPMLSRPKTRKTGLSIRTDFRLTESQQKAHRILNHSIYLFSREREGSDDDFAGKIAEYWQKSETRPGASPDTKPLAMRVRIEHAPRENSKVSLAKTKDALGLSNVELHLEFGELESRTISVIERQLSKQLGANNIGRMKIEFDASNTAWERDVGWQFHHLGGTRMHDTPDLGVVNKNCKVHSVNNLYIASSSVFPTGGQANPTMNIVALALRLADHLKKEMAS